MEQVMGKVPLKVVIGQNRSVVDALNNGAKQTTGNVLIYVSDDFECPPAWDLEIQKRLKGRRDEEWVLGVDDGHQHDTQTISILSRKYFERFGHIYHPEYFSVFVDNDFTETARRSGKMVNAFDLVFRHNHFTHGGLPVDDTYRRQNSPEAYASGKAIFDRRASENFGLSA
jgi:glycosyltransferase involved in cell wall biosynthesis